MSKWRLFGRRLLRRTGRLENLPHGADGFFDNWLRKRRERGTGRWGRRSPGGSDGRDVGGGDWGRAEKPVLHYTGAPLKRGSMTLPVLRRNGRPRRSRPSASRGRPSR